MAGVAAQVARSLPIRVRSLVTPTAQVRMSRTHRRSETKSSIRPHTDKSVPSEQWPANPSPSDGRAHTCRQQFISGWRPLPTDGRLLCRVWHARGMRGTLRLGNQVACSAARCPQRPLAPATSCHAFFYGHKRLSCTTPSAVSAASCGGTLVIAWSTRLRPRLTCEVADMTVIAS